MERGRTPRKVWLVPSLAWIGFILLQADSAMAQRKSGAAQRTFQPGDEIEYLWLNNWYPGEVLEVNGQKVAISYQWNNIEKRESVDSFKLRHAWEAKALTPMRFWRDAKKQFRVRAAAIGLEDGKVTLHKEDGAEVSVPVEILSDADKRILAKIKTNLQKSAATAAPALPDLSTFDLKEGSTLVDWQNNSDLSELTPDSPRSLQQLPSKGVLLQRTSIYESLAFLAPIGGEAAWMVAGTTNWDTPGRLIWASLKSGQIKKAQWLPANEKLIAVHPSSRQVLTYNTSESDGPTLTVWNADPRTDKATAKVRWKSAKPGGWASPKAWAEFVSPTRVIHRWDDQEYVVWDFQSKSRVYTIVQESFFGAPLAFSPKKKYVAIPEDSRVRVLEASSGQTLASLPISGANTSGVGFDPTGEKLAILNSAELAVWRLSSSEEPERYRSDSMASGLKATIDWVDDQSVLINRSQLFHLDLESPIWSYQAGHDNVQETASGSRILSVKTGMLCYAVRVGSGGDYVIGAVELPGPGVQEAIDGFDKTESIAIGPGDRVRLEVNCGSFTGEVTQALETKIKENGWVFDPSADSVLMATMKQGERQTLEYKSIHGNRNQQTVSVQPYISSLKIRYDAHEVWSMRNHAGLPPVMFLEKGETAQSKLRDQEEPDPDFFRQVTIPKTIFDTSSKRGLGMSVYTQSGLVPTPGSVTNSTSDSPPVRRRR